jgi:RNA polymerase sigma-70 factor (ECF subfamily)
MTEDNNIQSYKQGDDNEIVRGLKHGNEKDLQILIDRLYPILIYLSIAIISNKEEAEDIVWKVFTSYWDKRSCFEEMKNIKAYLFIATRNNCLNFLKYQKRRRRFETEYAKIIEIPNEEDMNRMQIESELLGNVFEQIDELPAGCKEVFVLTYLFGFTPFEASELLSVSVSTIYSQRSIAIDKLKLLLF